MDSPFDVLLLAVVAEGYADFLNSLSANAVYLATFYHEKLNINMKNNKR